MRDSAKQVFGRRRFLGLAGGAVLGGAAGFGAPRAVEAAETVQPERERTMKLGLVTYNMGKDMTVDELIQLCVEAALEGVELRTTHAHGVEVELSKAEREAVRKRFADSPVELAGLGSAFEFHSKDPDEVRRNIEGSKAYAQLAADVGAPGIKLRPNGLYDDEPVEQTCERIGRAWTDVARFAADVGVETRMEVHGRNGSALPVNMRKMVDAADHPNALICWNSNPSDMDENGSIEAGFELLKDSLGLVHINAIGTRQYPWQDLFDRLKEMGYAGFCLAEIAYNPEPERFMRYYRTLFDFYIRAS